MFGTFIPLHPPAIAAGYRGATTKATVLSLTLEIEHRLKAKGFDELYDNNTPKWVDMATTAKTYTESFIDTDTEKVRPGDVAESLQNAIKIDPDFEAHLAVKKLTQKYWVRYFTDYILDRIYPIDITQ